MGFRKTIWVAGFALAASASAYAKPGGLRPGVDLSFDYAVTDMEWMECHWIEGASTCLRDHDLLATAGPGVALYLQKPVRKKRFLRVLHADWGVSLPLLYYNLSNDVDKNAIDSYSVDVDGNIIPHVPSNQIAMRYLTFQPSLYAQAGLAIPYLPWLLVTAGLGPELSYGELRFNGESRRFHGVAPGGYLEVELNVLRTKTLGVSLYSKSFPFLTERQLAIHGSSGLGKSEDDPHRFKMTFGTTSAGLRVHTNW